MIWLRSCIFWRENHRNDMHIWGYLMYLLSHGYLYHLLKMVSAGFSAVKWSVLLLWKSINIFIYSTSPQHYHWLKGHPVSKLSKCGKVFILEVSTYSQSRKIGRRKWTIREKQQQLATTKTEPWRMGSPRNVVMCLSLSPAPMERPLRWSQHRPCPSAPSTSNFCIRKQTFCLLFHDK